MSDSVRFREDLLGIVVKRFDASPDEKHISAKTMYLDYIGGEGRYVPPGAIRDVCKLLARIRTDLEDRGYHCALVCEEFFRLLEYGQIPKDKKEFQAAIAGSGGHARSAYGLSRDAKLYCAYREVVADKATGKSRTGFEQMISAAASGDVPVSEAFDYLRFQVEAMRPSNTSELVQLLVDPERKRLLDALLSTHPFIEGEAEDDEDELSGIDDDEE